MFFTIRQNNINGSHVLNADKGIGHCVIVEGKTLASAQKRFNKVTKKFNGYCNCCGSRFGNTLYTEDATLTPEPMFFNGYEVAYVHRTNGTIDVITN